MPSTTRYVMCRLSQEQGLRVRFPCTKGARKIVHATGNCGDSLNKVGNSFDGYARCRRRATNAATIPHPAGKQRTGRIGGVASKVGIEAEGLALAVA